MKWHRHPVFTLVSRLTVHPNDARSNLTSHVLTDACSCDRFFCRRFTSPLYSASISVLCFRFSFFQAIFTVLFVFFSTAISASWRSMRSAASSATRVAFLARCCSRLTCLPRFFTCRPRSLARMVSAFDSSFSWAWVVVQSATRLVVVVEGHMQWCGGGGEWCALTYSPTHSLNTDMSAIKLQTFAIKVRSPLLRASIFRSLREINVTRPLACDAFAANSRNCFSRRRLHSFFTCLFPWVIARTTVAEFSIASRPIELRAKWRTTESTSSLHNTVVANVASFCFGVLRQVINFGVFTPVGEYEVLFSTSFCGRAVLTRLHLLSLPAHVLYYQRCRSLLLQERDTSDIYGHTRPTIWRCSHGRTCVHTVAASYSLCFLDISYKDLLYGYTHNNYYCTYAASTHKTTHTIILQRILDLCQRWIWSSRHTSRCGNHQHTHDHRWSCRCWECNLLHSPGTSPNFSAWTLLGCVCGCDGLTNICHVHIHDRRPWAGQHAREMILHTWTAVSEWVNVEVWVCECVFFYDRHTDPWWSWLSLVV